MLSQIWGWLVSIKCCPELTAYKQLTNFVSQLKIFVCQIDALAVSTP